MLHCTETAATSLRELGRHHGVPEDYGVRVFASETPDGDPALGIAFADRPREGDQVAEQHGTRVFVAREVADQLDDVELDVAPDVSSNGNEPAQLVLRSRPDATD